VAHQSAEEGRKASYRFSEMTRGMAKKGSLAFEATMLEGGSKKRGFSPGMVDV